MTRAGILRGFGGVVAALLLVGPAPGAVGSCGGDPLDQPAELESYCKEREQLICVRRAMREKLPDVKRDGCRYDAIELCSSRFWKPGCAPTVRQARACLNALRSFDTLKTPEDQIDECKTDALCKLPMPPMAGRGAQ
jgi:hypothetical protein